MTAPPAAAGGEVVSSAGPRDRTGRSAAGGRLRSTPPGGRHRRDQRSVETGSQYSRPGPQRSAERSRPSMICTGRPRRTTRRGIGSRRRRPAAADGAAAARHAQRAGRRDHASQRRSRPRRPRRRRLRVWRAAPVAERWRCGAVERCRGLRRVRVLVRPRRQRNRTAARRAAGRITND